MLNEKIFENRTKGFCFIVDQTQELFLGHLVYRRYIYTLKPERESLKS